MLLLGFHCWFQSCWFKSSISTHFKSLCCSTLVDYRVVCGHRAASTSLIPAHIRATNGASICRGTTKYSCALLSSLKRWDGDFCRFRLPANTSVSMDSLFVMLHYLCGTAREGFLSSLGLMRLRHFIWPHYPSILHLASSFGHSFISLHPIYCNKWDVLNRQPSI